MASVSPPVDSAEALAMISAGSSFLAEADATAMGVAEQARCLRGLVQGHAVSTAAGASILGAFTAGQGHIEDGHYSARVWLMRQLRVSRGEAAGLVGWSRRVQAHPQVGVALAAGWLSDSWGRQIAKWTDQLPEDCRLAADAILLGAAENDADLQDLARLAAEIAARSGVDETRPDQFEDRSVRVETTFDGAGLIRGDLTPECTAFLTTVLDALSKPAGAEDTRTQAQRTHDALQDAMERLVAAGLLPERAGVPVRVWGHISMQDLMGSDDASALVRQWVADNRATWAAQRAAASEGGGDGGAWLNGVSARGMACDAAVAPVVTGTVSPGVLYHLVQLSFELAELGYLGHYGQIQVPAGPGTLAGPGGSPGLPGAPDAPDAATIRAFEALEQAIVGQAVRLLSGPGGLVSFVRRGMMGGSRLGGPSIPLDIGYSENVPAGIRNAVRLRDQHCQWAGGCHQPAGACQVHHTTHKANGGKTSLQDCVLLCFFHHQICIHRLGWTLVVNPDGTTTAWNKDRTKTLHSHGPPARPG